MGNNGFHDLGIIVKGDIRSIREIKTQKGSFQLLTVEVIGRNQEPNLIRVTNFSNTDLKLGQAKLNVAVNANLYKEVPQINYIAWGGQNVI